MIPKQELREGNIFKDQYSGENDFFKVWGFDKERIWYGNEYSCTFEEAIPISLTPEILEKCGYVPDGFNCYDWQISWYDDQYRRLVLDLNQGYLWIREGSGFTRHKDSLVCLWNRDIKKELYLHQLQNLFFTLTGEELEIKSNNL